MQSQYGGRPGGYAYGYGPYGTGSGSGSGSVTPERGSRRRKLAAVAGSIYRSGVAAASELKEQYNNTRMRGVDMTGAQVSIPGAFPNVSIVTKGDEQMVLFPTYAKQHVKGLGGGQGGPQSGQPGLSEEEYWKQEWSRAEDEKAVVDVDVRGWIYMPSKGPMTRRNRMLVGLARRLSGIPAPTIQSDEEMTEEQRIAREAREIEKRGQDEKEVANRGGYSEPPGGLKGTTSRATTSPSPPSPTLSARTPTVSQTDMTEAELAIANANLMARLGPFMTTPLVQIPITIFFYNDEQSRSHTVMTDDSGHFNVRVPLEFVPTEIRVIANENISTTRPIEITGHKGISLISDVDDTIKHSNISMGAREIFRNALVRDLADLTVDGVKEWYNTMHDMGVQLHYCSNSPWQLYPVLATFLHTAGLPQGSMHLKHYSGMLQGIFEPVAERKKGTLEAIIRDFPERKFLLVGDSGEADLEVYTELAVANPGRILAVFIRDVTTPAQPGFFDSSFSVDREQRSRQESTRVRPGTRSVGEQLDRRPPVPPRATASPASSGPVMGTLIDLDEPEPVSAAEAGQVPGRKSSQDMLELGTPSPDIVRRKVPPPRPAKPAALRSTPSDSSTTNSQKSTFTGTEADRGLPLRPRTSAGTSPNTMKPTPPPPPPPRRRGTAPTIQQPRNTADEPIPDIPNIDYLPATPGGYPSSFTETTNPPNGAATAAAVNKKVDMWLLRLGRAHETLDAQGVKLYTWRKGDDVIAEAEGLVREALRKMGKSN